MTVELDDDQPRPPLVAASGDGIFRAVVDFSGRPRHSLERNGRLVWQRYLDREPEPWWLGVSNQGQVAALCFCPRLTMLVRSPQEGQITARLDLLKIFCSGDESEHVCELGCGNLVLPQGELNLFFEHGDCQFWLVLTGSGLRCMVNLDESVAVPRPAEALEAARLEAEKALILALLKRGVNSADYFKSLSQPSSEPFLRDLEIAVQLCTFDDAIPLLHELERIDFISSSSSGGTYREVFGFFGTVFVRTLRIAVHHTLRRLGAFPAGYAPYRFGESPTPECVPGREQRAETVTTGMKAEAVLALLGCPDHCREWNYRQHIWEYHLCDSSPYTLRLHFKNPADGVAEKHCLRPATWQTHG